MKNTIIYIRYNNNNEININIEYSAYIYAKRVHLFLNNASFILYILKTIVIIKFNANYWMLIIVSINYYIILHTMRCVHGFLSRE